LPSLHRQHGLDPPSTGGIASGECKRDSTPTTREQFISETPTVTTLSFKPGLNHYVIGKEKSFHDLQVGEKRTIIWASENLEVEELPDSAEDHRAVLPPLSK
jgi:hypothetical protein